MTQRRIDQKIVPIDWIDDEERWILVPPTDAEIRRRRREKRIIHKKDRCLFTVGVPKSIVDFTYRAVRKLDLTGRTLIFSRGTVRIMGRLRGDEVSIHELDWGVGILITIPRHLPYNRRVKREVDGVPLSFRLMELAVLEGLLKLAFPRHGHPFYRNAAARVIARGWSHLERDIGNSP